MYLIEFDLILLFVKYFHCTDSHGGPGSGTSPRDSRYFDPAAYRIILFDQRGSGQSTPSAELRVCHSYDSWSAAERMVVCGTEGVLKNLGCVTELRVVFRT